MAEKGGKKKGGSSKCASTTTKKPVKGGVGRGTKKGK